jgi:hypothetical protein
MASLGRTPAARRPDPYSARDQPARTVSPADEMIRGGRESSASDFESCGSPPVTVPAAYRRFPPSRTACSGAVSKREQLVMPLKCQYAEHHLAGRDGCR